MNKPVNLFAITRINDLNKTLEYERLVTKSNEDVRIQKHEMDSLRSFVKLIVESGVSAGELDGFYHSYTINQIGKEFDLIKLSDNYLINIELKSENIDEDKIRDQLLKNKYYLKFLGTTNCFYTYVMSTSTIYTLNSSDNLEKVGISEIVSSLKKITDFFKGDLSEKFKVSNYLVSPINTPEKFLSDGYFLTQQQLEIKNEIINIHKPNGVTYYGITGDPGTGKTLLLYDIAKTYSKTLKCCIVHCGMLSNGHNYIDAHSPNMSVIPIKEINQGFNFDCYDCFFIDESHRIYKSQFELIVKYCSGNKKTCFFSYDKQQTLSYNEERTDIVKQIEQLPNICTKRLSQKIRSNKEIAGFIKKLFNLNYGKELITYGNVEVLFANNVFEANYLKQLYQSDGYEYIYFTSSNYKNGSVDAYNYNGNNNTHEVIGQEFDNVLMIIDSTFYYDNNILSSKTHPNPDYIYTKLFFQGLTRVREKLCLIIAGDINLFDKIISIFK